MAELTKLEQTERRIEAILFAGGEPIEGKKIAEIIEVEETTVRKLVERIRDRYNDIKSPVDIVQLDESYQMVTRPQYAPDIRAALEIRKGAVLSQAAMEVLAVVAYNQPVTRAFVEQVRGVDCSSLVRSLCEKGLIEEAGRMDIPGKPIMYRTTSVFLRCFGIDTLEQLPRLPESIVEEDNEQVEGQIDFFEETILKELEEE